MHSAVSQCCESFGMLNSNMFFLSMQNCPTLVPAEFLTGDLGSGGLFREETMDSMKSPVKV